MTTLTCAEVEARDLDAGYLAGRLSPDDATAYEAHYFGCDRCWAALRLASEARAGLAVGGSGAGVPAVAPRRWRPRNTWGLATAATLLLVAGTVQFLSSRRAIEPEAALLRGPAEVISVRAATAEGALSAMWSRVPGADRYRVRLFGEEGQVLVERETADTALTVALDSLDAPARTGARYWQVLALDRLRRPLARSPLTATSPPSPPPP